MQEHRESIEAIVNGSYCPLPVGIIPDRMGINLCSVDAVSWTKQADGQLVSLTVHFKPDPVEQMQ